MPTSERMARYAEDAQDRASCPIHKGPLDECNDPETVWYPQRLICRKTMDQAAADRKWAELHEKAPWHSGNFDDWATERSDSHPFHYTDGVRVWVDKTDWNPDDDFLSR